jgi:hypothetical protein
MNKYKKTEILVIFWNPSFTQLSLSKRKTSLFNEIQTSNHYGTLRCEVLHLEHSFVWGRNLDSSEIRSEVSGKFWNVVLEKDGEDKLDRPRK